MPDLKLNGRMTVGRMKNLLEILTGRPLRVKDGYEKSRGGIPGVCPKEGRLETGTSDVLVSISVKG